MYIPNKCKIYELKESLLNKYVSIIIIKGNDFKGADLHSYSFED